MKKLLILLLVLALQVGNVQAASLTITTDSATDTRLAIAYGKILGLVDGSGVPRNATAAEVKAAIIQRTIDDVQTSEVRAQQSAVTRAPISQMN